MRDQSDVLTRRFKTQKEQARELRRRYDELVAAGKGNTTQAKNLQSQYNNTTAQMNRTEQQLKSLNDEIKRQESPWTILGDRKIGRASCREREKRSVDGGTVRQRKMRGMNDRTM